MTLLEMLSNVHVITGKLAIGSEDRVQPMLFHIYMTLVTLKIQSQGHENLIIPFGCPK